MKIKNLLIGTVIASIVYYLLGWLFYGVLFSDIYPSNGNENLAFMYLGCLFYALLVSFVIIQWADIKTWGKGLTIGAILGCINTIAMNFFMYSMQPLNLRNMILDVVIGTVSFAILGLIVAEINRGLEKNK